MRLDDQREIGLQVKVRPFFVLTRLSLDAGDSDRILSASHQNSFVGPEPCPTHQIREESDLTKLTRQAQRRPDLAPRVRARQTVGKISETINLNKCERRSGNISHHVDAGRAPQRKGSDNNNPNS